MRQQLYGARTGCIGAHGLVQLQHFSNLVAHRVQRVQRRHRLLEDHADVAAAYAAHLALALGQQIRTVETDGTRGGGRIGEAQHRHGGDRLARTRFTDQCKLFAGADGKRHVVHDSGRSEAHREVLDF